MTRAPASLSTRLLGAATFVASVLVVATGGLLGPIDVGVAVVIAVTGIAFDSRRGVPRLLRTEASRASAQPAKVEVRKSRREVIQ